MVIVMSREISFFEESGGTYRERDGIFYPDISFGDSSLFENIDVGKYGCAWINYLKDNHSDRYRHYVRIGSLLQEASEVNEEAYEVLNVITEQYLAKNKPNDTSSTMEMWKVREEAKLFAEETVYQSVIWKCRE